MCSVYSLVDHIFFTASQTQKPFFCCWLFLKNAPGSSTHLHIRRAVAIALAIALALHHDDHLINRSYHSTIQFLIQSVAMEHHERRASSSQKDKYYFVPDEEQVYRIAILEPLDEPNPSSLLKIIPIDEATGHALPQAASEAAVATIHEVDAIAIDSFHELKNLPSDLIKLKNVNRATILLTLRERFQRDEIYTSIGSILIAVNPFKWIPGLYEDNMIDSYRNTKDTVHMQSYFPHTFAVTRAAFDELAATGGNQSLIISGKLA
jgi:hypothetical protein